LVGTVHDASTGRLVPRFRIVCGWPQVDGRDGRVSPRWSTLDRHAIGFCGGTFRHEIVDPIPGADTNPGYVFRFEAEGYSPFVSRVVADGEAEVRFDVALRSADAATDEGPVPEGPESDGARSNAE
ncbi:MAG: hypothetical protein JNL97_06400, partial [Verrucomicrobiales bacterium]|nr:hypothetical protein [Verrucomicrobiales bacterium]